MLSAVRIPGPKHHDKRFPIFLKHRQNRLCQRIREVLLLNCVGDKRARRRIIPGKAVVLFGGRRRPVRTVGRDRWKMRIGKRLHNSGIQRYAASLPGGIIDDNRFRNRHETIHWLCLCCILNKRRAELANRRSVVAVRGRKGKQSLLMQEIPSKMFVDTTEYSIVFDKRSLSFTKHRERVSRIHGVAKVPGVAEKMPRRDRRGIRCCECRKEGVAIYEENALFTDEAHRWSVYFVNRSLTKTVRNKDYCVPSGGNPR